MKTTPLKRKAPLKKITLLKKTTPLIKNIDTEADNTTEKKQQH
jgi:hypothetical protein